jgi:hypothetical protein
VAVVASFTALVSVLLYFDLRARQEQARAVGAAVGAPTFAAMGSEE